jgi:glycosyltransferase involved in cell wall biosynthesis
MNYKVKISVMIPVFNGEKYIAKTIDSILKQSLKDFEIVCVNDSSTDNCSEILQKYAALDNRVRVFNTEFNHGISSKVLNLAIPICTGEYIFYMSQDDLLSEDVFENLYNKAVNTKADAVIPDVHYYFENMPVKKAIIGVNNNRDIELTNREAVLLSLNWEISGFALWNANIVKEKRYAEFGINGDEYSVRHFFLACNKVVFSEGVFLYRQDNPNAITKKLSYKSFDLPYTHLMLYRFLRENGFPIKDYSKELIKCIKRLINFTIALQKNIGKFSYHERLEAECRIKRCFNSLQDENPIEIIGDQIWIHKWICKLALKYEYKQFYNFCYIAGMFPIVHKYNKLRT